ncbi:bifunctional diguanylate cyclase/phosphodiesterase [Roseibium sp. MMSF_3544]|uniref:putative bifunctional diguanylate cyclase/phosphodiesterase n=1 Tax=unclassified Roseibium TaxID=2629323 RepID=UPI00273F1E8E|nr:EAL domain-containing protein [Roseibium sp. MMSF_3544]
MHLQNNENTDVLSRIRNFNASLDELMRIYTGDKSTSAEFTRIVTKETAKQLRAQRVSAWSVTPDKKAIDCIALYLADEDRHVSDLKLSVEDFPKYFEAVLTERVIAANDADQDPRTSEFTEHYLRPNRILSMLDAQIRSAGGPRGVVCVETVDVRREWSPDEIAFTASIAELLGFSMDREDRGQVSGQLEEINDKLSRAVEEAREANERYDLAIHAAYDGVWDLDNVTGRVYFSDQNFKLLGEQYDDPPSDFEWWQSRVHPEDIDGVLEYYEKLLLNDSPYNVTYRMRHRDGSWRWWRSRGKVVRDSTSAPIRIVGTNSDVTDLIETKTELEKRNQELLNAKRNVEHTALHDSLTCLPNRRYMEQVFTEKFCENSAKDGTTSFLHIDLDHFKDVNDMLGHAAGDTVLRLVADLLRDLSEEGDFIARIGGDEFVAILQDNASAERSIAFSEQLIAQLARPVFVEGSSFSVGVSVGIALLDESTPDASQLLRNADHALYQAKHSGKNRFELYSDQMRVQAAYVRQTKEEIQRALEEDGSFVPFFQPQFFAGSLQLAGAEALVRWHHPVRGILAPGDFLQYAEDMNCVAEIDRQVLVKSLSAAGMWRDAGLVLPRLAVNVSSGRLADPGLLLSIAGFKDKVPSLSFELIESTYLDDTNEQIRQTLRQLRNLDVEIEIDDFGSGYASIASLVNIRPKRLKIDRTLTANVDSDATMSRLVQSIVDIARTLNVEVIAEGAETQSQIEALTAIGCDILQGFGLARPMSADMFLETFSVQNPIAAPGRT